MKRLMTILLTIFMVAVCAAQDEVTLTVTGSGATKEEAVNNALRSAVAQTYGVFVSANTRLLNDELIKDEIATVTSGNIKKYDEVGEFDLPNGRKEVTIQTTVCISKLIDYAQSKGASVEFAGKAFAKNIKILELNKKNELDALNILLKQVKLLLPYCFDKNLIVSNPKLPGVRRDYVWYGAYHSYIDYMKEKNKKISYKWPYKWSIKGTEYEYEINNAYLLPIEIVYTPNKNLEVLKDLFINTIKKISLTEEESKIYDDSNIDTWEIRYISSVIPFPENKTVNPYPVILVENEKRQLDNWRPSWYNDMYVLRNSHDSLKKWAYEVKKEFLKNYLTFDLIDNLGEHSRILDPSLFSNIRCWETGDASEQKFNVKSSHFSFHYNSEDQENYIFGEGTGIFSPFVRIHLDSDENKIYLKIQILIPKEDISNYSQFELSK